MLDLLTLQISRMRRAARRGLRRRRLCTDPAAPGAPDAAGRYEVDFASLDGAAGGGFVSIDIREPDEVAARARAGHAPSVSCPCSGCCARPGAARPSREATCWCARSGQRSLAAAADAARARLHAGGLAQRWSCGRPAGAAAAGLISAPRVSAAAPARAAHHVLVTRQLLHAHRPAGVELIGRNADLRAHAELAAVGELCRGVVQHDRAVDLLRNRSAVAAFSVTMTRCAPSRSARCARSPASTPSTTRAAMIASRYSVYQSSSVAARTRASAARHASMATSNFN